MIQYFKFRIMCPRPIRLLTNKRFVRWYKGERYVIKVKVIVAKEVEWERRESS